MKTFGNIPDQEGISIESLGRAKVLLQFSGPPLHTIRARPDVVDAITKWIKSKWPEDYSPELPNASSFYGIRLISDDEIPEGHAKLIWGNTS